MADTETPRTAVDVLTEHAIRDWDQEGRYWCPSCSRLTKPLVFSSCEAGVQHQADMLAAAGLLATAEHDREVAARALRGLVADRADIERALALVDGSSVSVVDLIVRHVESEAARIAAGEES